MQTLIDRVRATRDIPEPAHRRALRKACGVSQAEAAAALGVDRTTFSRWESGVTQPRGKHLSPYIELLDYFRNA